MYKQKNGMYVECGQKRTHTKEARKRRGIRLVAAAVCVLLATGMFASCGQWDAAQAEKPENAGTRTFTDSCGRTVELDAQITRVAVSGPMAQSVVFAMAPDRLVGIPTAWSEPAKEYLDETYLDLPVLGQVYGGKGEMNLETLLSTGAQVVIDIGEPKDSVGEDMDTLQQQTGIPFVHIDSSLVGMGETFTMTGELLGLQDLAAEMAVYWDERYAMVTAATEGKEKPQVLYITGADGLHVIARGSYHAQILDMLTENVAVVEQPSSLGSGNEADMEQFLAWNPACILFDPTSIYDDVAGMEDWQNLTAIAEGRYYEVPIGPDNWMGFPPSVQQMLGMLWMGKLFYPETCTYDLQQEVTTFYEMFYHCQLTDDRYAALIANSIGKADA